MKTIKELRVTVTYNVILEDVEVSDTVFEQLTKPDEISIYDELLIGCKII